MVRSSTIMGWAVAMAGGRAGTPYRGLGVAHTARPALEGVIVPKQIGQFTVAMMLGGVLAGELSWRWALFVNVPIGVGLLAATV